MKREKPMLNYDESEDDEGCDMEFGLELDTFNDKYASDKES